MRLGIVTDIEVRVHDGCMVAPYHQIFDWAAFCPHFDEVVVFSPRQNGYDPADPQLNRVPLQNMRVAAIEGFWPKIHGFALTWPRVRISLRRLLPQVDLVNVEMPRLCGLLAPGLCRKLGIPYFMTIIADWREQFRVARGLGGWRRWAMPLAAAIPEFAQNRAARGAVVFSTSPDILTRVRPFARAAHWTYISVLTEADLVAAPRMLSSARRPRLLYAGVVEPHKGVRDALEAVRLLRDAGVDFEFHILGSGSLEREAQDFVRRHDLQDQVTLHGFVPWGPRLLEHFNASDLFVFPSFSEGSPKVILEALFKALVVVATPVGAIPAVIQDRLNGRLTPLRDPRALAQTLREVIADPAQYASMSAAALRSAADLTQAQITRRWIERLREADLYRDRATEAA